jgi:hypothetical protein
MFNTVTCLKCGWVHFAVTRQYAEDEIARFNAYYDTLPADKQQQFYDGQKSAISSYDTCGCCGGPYTNFRDSKPGDSPDGCTLNPIIHYSET